MKIINIMLGLLFLFMSACEAEGGSTDRDSSANATYRVTFIHNWTALDFPTNFPTGSEHFSGLIGATHNNQVNFWQNGVEATRGIEVVAETGSKFSFEQEIIQEKAANRAQFLLSGSGLSTGVNRTSLEFDINESYPLVTLISMLAPSPDWFMGVHDLLLFRNGQWVQSLSMNLPLYDAGTDSGRRFNSSNSNSSNLISLLTSTVGDTDFTNGINRSTGKHVGRFIFEKIN